MILCDIEQLIVAGELAKEFKISFGSRIEDMSLYNSYGTWNDIENSIDLMEEKLRNQPHFRMWQKVIINDSKETNGMIDGIQFTETSNFIYKINGKWFLESLIKSK